jgi:biotin transport system substrate-specific component
MQENQKKTKSYVAALPLDTISVKAFWISTFAVLTALGAQMEIPIYPVPFTLQTFFVLLSGALLGKQGGALSMCLYLFLGAIGLPIFSGGTMGIAKIIGPTGGYLLAFPVAAYSVGYLISMHRGVWWITLSVTIGSMIIFVFGTIQLNYILFHNWGSSIKSGFLIFSFWDIIKIVGAASISSYYLKKQ